MMRYFGPDWQGNASNSALYPQMNDYMKQMMGPYGGYFWQFQWILCLLTWVLVIVLLVALIRWIWKKGDK